MKEWLTAREIAEQVLPDVPATESAVIRLAKREGWNAHPTAARPRTGHGGGMEYHISRLPTLAQVAYMQRHLRRRRSGSRGTCTGTCGAADGPRRPGAGRPPRGRRGL